MKAKKPKPEPIQAPVPIREPTYWMQVSLTECLALADGVVPDAVRSKAGMVDQPSPVPGIQAYATILP